MGWAAAPWPWPHAKPPDHPAPDRGPAADAPAPADGRAVVSALRGRCRASGRRVHVAAKLGLKLAYLDGAVTALWPPVGVGIAALVLLGPRYWPGVLIGDLLVA